MKLFKLLFLSCTLTFALCASLFPVSAQPLENKPTIHLANLSKVPVVSNTALNLPSRFSLSSPMELTEEDQYQSNVINKQNEFFEAAVQFNEKLQQVIAFFSSSHKKVAAKDSYQDEKEVAKYKCDGDYS